MIGVTLPPPSNVVNRKSSGGGKVIGLALPVRSRRARAFENALDELPHHGLRLLHGSAHVAAQQLPRIDIHGDDQRVDRAAALRAAAPVQPRFERLGGDRAVRAPSRGPRGASAPRAAAPAPDCGSRYRRCPHRARGRDRWRRRRRLHCSALVANLRSDVLDQARDEPRLAAEPSDDGAYGHARAARDVLECHLVEPPVPHAFVEGLARSAERSPAALISMSTS